MNQLSYNEVIEFARVLLRENTALRKQLEEKSSQLQVAQNALHGAEDTLYKVIKERNGQ